MATVKQPCLVKRPGAVLTGADASSVEISGSVNSANDVSSTPSAQGACYVITLATAGQTPCEIVLDDRFVGRLVAPEAPAGYSAGLQSVGMASTISVPGSAPSGSAAAPAHGAPASVASLTLSGSLTSSNSISSTSSIQSRETALGLLATLPADVISALHHELARLGHVTHPVATQASSAKLATTVRSAIPQTAAAIPSDSLGRWIHYIAVDGRGAVQTQSEWRAEAPQNNRQTGFFFNLARRAGRNPLRNSTGGHDFALSSRRPKGERRLPGFGLLQMSSAVSTAENIVMPGLAPAVPYQPKGFESERTHRQFARETGDRLRTVSDRGHSSGGSPEGDPEGQGEWIVEEETEDGSDVGHA